MRQLEHRTAELRSDGRTLYGRAAPYEQWAQIGTFREKIERGAFAGTLASGEDVLLLADHDMQRLLARMSNGSLRLDDQADGLHFRAELAEFTLANDVLAQARAGLLGGVSIGFYVDRDTWSADRAERSLLSVTLAELSAVSAFAAYPNTTIQARAAEGRHRARERAMPPLVLRYLRP